jgi:hypothetical protein
MAVSMFAETKTRHSPEAGCEATLALRSELKVALIPTPDAGRKRVWMNLPDAPFAAIEHAGSGGGEEEDAGSIHSTFQQRS